MDYKVCRPPGHLQALVQCYWSLQSNPDEPVPRDYFLMADNCPEIIFQYDEGFEAYAAQSARMRFQHSVHGNFRVGKKVGFFGVRLYPQAIYQLLNIPAPEVVNQVFDFAELFKQDGADVADQVYIAANFEQRMALISAFLTRRAGNPNPDAIIDAANRLMQSAGTIHFRDLLRDSGLSLRQFERRFKFATGFGPKYFARISRFQSVKDNFCFHPEVSMTNLAYSCNYFDQAHFNKEFKEFSGVQPLDYFKAYRYRQTDLRFSGYLPCGWFK